jgi:hypothetical protein
MISSAFTQRPFAAVAHFRYHPIMSAMSPQDPSHADVARETED